jgi:hypothetical protein
MLDAGEADSSTLTSLPAVTLAWGSRSHALLETPLPVELAADFTRLEDFSADWMDSALGLSV